MDTPIEKDRGRVRNIWKGKENYYEEKGLRPCDVAERPIGRGPKC